jgi:hypothetical protein
MFWTQIRMKADRGFRPAWTATLAGRLTQRVLDPKPIAVCRINGVKRAVKVLFIALIALGIVPQAWQVPVHAQTTFTLTIGGRVGAAEKSQARMARLTAPSLPAWYLETAQKTIKARSLSS